MGILSTALCGTVVISTTRSSTTVCAMPSPAPPGSGRLTGFLARLHLCHDFRREIVLALFNPLADDVERECRDRSVVGFEHVGDRLLVVLHEGLAEQSHFLQ